MDEKYKYKKEDVADKYWKETNIKTKGVFKNDERNS